MATKASLQITAGEDKRDRDGGDQLNLNTYRALRVYPCVGLKRPQEVALDLSM